MFGLRSLQTCAIAFNRDINKDVAEIPDRRTGGHIIKWPKIAKNHILTYRRKKKMIKIFMKISSFEIFSSRHGKRLFHSLFYLIKFFILSRTLSFWPYFYFHTVWNRLDCLCNSLYILCNCIDFFWLLANV